MGQFLIMAALCLALVLPAVAEDTTHVALYEDAVAYLSDGDVDAALIQAKNALLENPAHLPSRILLGNIYLLQGYGADAEKELKIALELGAARDSVMLPLGDALLLQRKYQEILDTIVPDTPQLRRVAAIYTLRARAHYELGELEEARLGFEHAQNLEPEALGPLFGLTQVAIQQDDLSKAEEKITRARDLAPEDAEVWFMTGEVLRASGEPEGALSAYSRALELSVGHMRARMARARLYLQQRQYEEALEDARWATEAQEFDPEPPFLASQALAQLGRDDEALLALKDARAKLTQLKTEFVTSRPGLLRVAAMLSFADNNLEQANFYLGLYVAQSPYDVEMRKVLGQVRLQLGDAGGAVRALYPAQKTHGDDPELLYLLGDALLRTGRYGEAFNLLEQAMAKDSDSAVVLTRLALSRMGLGESELAIADLQKALAMSDASSNLQAGVILTTVYIKRGMQEEAMQVAKTLVARAPSNPGMHNLQGLVHLSMDHPHLARLSFEEAHKLAADYTPAIYNLALLDMNEKNYSSAEARYQEVLAINKGAVQAMLGMSDIALRRDDQQAAISWLTQAVAQDSDNLEPSIRLINLYLRTGQTDKAFVEAEMFKRLHPDTLQAHVLYARALTARGDLEGAITSYRSAVRYAGFSGNDLLQIAAAQQNLKDFDGAHTTLVKALDTDHAQAARAATVKMKIQLNDLDGAMIAAEQVISEAPDQSAGYLLRGDVQLAQKRHTEALESYRQAYRRLPSREAVMGMYRAQTLLGKHPEARQVMLDWLESHPGDDFVRRNLAIAYLVQGKRDAAQAEFEHLYDKGEHSPVVMANLARIYQLQGDPRALDYARQALEGNPTWSVALDTYGWLLVTEGEPEEGLKYLREAVSRDSDPLIRYHLAATLSELNRKEEARLALRAVLKSEADPVLMDAAKKLDSDLADALSSG